MATVGAAVEAVNCTEFIRDVVEDAGTKLKEMGFRSVEKAVPLEMKIRGIDGGTDFSTSVSCIGVSLKTEPSF